MKTSAGSRLGLAAIAAAVVSACSGNVPPAAGAAVDADAAAGVPPVGAVATLAPGEFDAAVERAAIEMGRAAPPKPAARLTVEDVIAALDRPGAAPAGTAHPAPGAGGQAPGEAQADGPGL